MPSPQDTAMHPPHSTTSSNTNDDGSDSEDLLAPSPNTKTALTATTSRPFTIGRRSSTNTNNKHGRPIYGRRSKSYDPRLNSRVANEDRVPMDVRVVPSNSSRGQEEVEKKLKRTSNTVQQRRRSEGAAGLSTWSTKDDGERESDDRAKNNHHDIATLEVCEDSMSPDVADYQPNDHRDCRRDDVIGRSKSSSKRRLSFPDGKGDEDDNHHNSLPAKQTTSEKKERTKVKRRRTKHTVNDDENIRPHHAHKEVENLSFTETVEQEYLPIPQSSRRRSSVGTKATTITIHTKSKKGGIVLPRSSKSYIKELRDLAKANNGTATQYKATYHTGSKPIIDKNCSAVSGSSGSNMIQVGQLIIKETSVTLKGKKGGNSYLFEGWKLPGSKQRDSSIYDSTRPKLIGVDDSSAVVLTTCAPHLIVDMALSVEDAARVRKFVMEAESGQTPMEFFAREDDDGDNGESDEGKEALNGGSMVSEEENERSVDDGRKVLRDRSNTAGRAQLKGKVQKSPNMKLSNKYHKARTKSARKKRKSAHISPTEPRKKRMVDSIVRFYVPNSKEDCQKYFGLIEGIGGGLEERGLSNVTPHRGRLLELPGAVLSGQWETRLVKDKAGEEGSARSLRISLRHEHSSLRSLEYLLTGKDDTPDGHFVSVIKPAIDRTHSLIRQGVFLEKEFEVDEVGNEQISNDAFIGCVSLVLFDGFLSGSEAVGESRDVASRFLKNCVPSNELQSGRELYGIVGNEHNSNDDENITGMLFPCNASFESEHVVLLLHNEELQVSGIDVLFRPSKNWSRHHTLTEALLDNHMDDTGSDDGEIMKRYIEKNIPSPMRPKPASVESNHDTDESEEEEVEQLSLGETGFDHNDEPDFDVNNDDLSSVRDPQPRQDENVHRLEEESRTLKQRIEILEEEKRLLEQQIVDKPSVETANIAKSKQSGADNDIADNPDQVEPCATNLATLAETANIVKSAEFVNDLSEAFNEIAVDPAQTEPLGTKLTDTLTESTNIANTTEYANDLSEAVNEIADDPDQIEPLYNNLTVRKKSKKIAFADLFGNEDSKQAKFESNAALNAQTVTEKKVVVEDLFGDNDSFFGASTKKRININRRKSTGVLNNRQPLFQKQNRGRHSTGGLRRNSVGEAKIIDRTTNQVELIPASKASYQRTSSTKRFVSASTAEKDRLVSSKSAKSSTVVTHTTRDSNLSERPQTKKSNRRTTLPIESRSKLRLSTGTNTSASKKNNVRVSRKKVNVADFFEDKTKKSNRRSALPTESRGKLRLSTSTSTFVSKKSNVKVADLFEDECGSMFGCAVKALSEKKKAKSTSIEASLIPNDMNSVSSLGDGSFSFESMSTQSLAKVHTNAVVDDRSENGDMAQNLFDVYFGKEMDACNEGAVLALQQAETQPFFDYYFGSEELVDDDESMQYSVQPFHSIYYGFDDQSTLHSITSSFEIPTVLPSLYYFDNDGIVPECVPTARPPFYDHYFGLDPFFDEDEDSSLVSSSSITSKQTPSSTAHPSFHDYYYGQEDFNGQECKVAAKPWRFELANCVRFLVIGVVPALLPAALLFSKQSSPNYSDQFFDAHGLDDTIVEEATSSWWSLKPWE